ncbi:MAG: HAMP domain-containing sensor histidine kinase, partial [Phycisphaerae bacterium]
YKRLIILASIIVLAICGLALLGYHSINIRVVGMQGARLGEFTEVAEQVRKDVKTKLDNFIQQEQNRPYTDYQYYSVPDVGAGTQQQLSLVVSPLAGRIENGLAYGNFEIEPDGAIITPFYSDLQTGGGSELSRKSQEYIINIKSNLLPELDSATTRTAKTSRELSSRESGDKKTAYEPPDKLPTVRMSKSKGEYQIESLEQSEQKPQVIEQPRQVAASNIAYREAVRQKADELKQKLSDQTEPIQEPMPQVQEQEQLQKFYYDAAESSLGIEHQYGVTGELPQNDKVQIRIEPFTPIVVPGDSKNSIFAGQIFMLRHVQIGNEHLLQGFKLNEDRLVEEIRDSAGKFIREGMDYRLDKNETADAVYSAILDFGFGEVTLNLTEKNPGWITSQISELKAWYFSIVAIVFITMVFVILSLWRSVRAQVKLAEQKDDFISAVSHELRTPLTSIRMYAEMLEKDWVKSKDKAQEYYRGMRQESERLSRLIENVLDFSRIQKKRKKYNFVLGDLNAVISNVIEVMRSYAAQAGFTVNFEPGELDSFAFDADAVTQIIVNLLDNAVKYARNAEDKTITIRTQRQGRLAVIEVEDHGPGVPHKQRDKVFDVFYRCEAETTRQTKGAGLGLSLVNKFAQAHNGFVQILEAKPHGAIFRIGLAVQA